jgi:hypothetical protein
VIPVDIDSPASGPVSVILDDPLPRLATVVVRAQMSDVAALTGFDKRALVGPGRYVTWNDLERNRSHCILDGIKLFLARGPGCTIGVAHNAMMHFRGVSTLQGLQPPPEGDPLRMPAATSASTACLEVYIDDLLEPPDARSGIVLSWLDPHEVVGIEYYTAASSPGRFGSSQCQKLLIWTLSYRGSHH